MKIKFFVTLICVWNQIKSVDKQLGSISQTFYKQQAGYAPEDPKSKKKKKHWWLFALFSKTHTEPKSAKRQ